MRERCRQGILLGWVAVFIFAPAHFVQAQLPGNPNGKDENLKISARFHVESSKDTGFLIVKLEIPKGSYIYGLKQQAPLSPSKLKVQNTKQFSVVKKFASDKKPTVIENDPVFQTRVEKYTGTVQFFVPIKVDTSADLKSLKPEIQYSGQICSERGFCKLINGKKVEAQFAGFFQREAKSVLPAFSEK